MNAKLLGALCLSQLFCQGFLAASAEVQKHLCPDMSQHERVLREGKQVERTIHSGRGSFYDYPLFLMPRQVISDYTPSKREYDLRASIGWLDDKVSTLPLNTSSQRQAAESYARQFEELGMYPNAALLYKRLLDVPKYLSENDSRRDSHLRGDYERALLCKEAQDLLVFKKDYTSALTKADSVVENISSSEMDTLSKSYLLNRVLKSVIDKAVQFAAADSGATGDSVTKYRRVKSHAEELLTTWKKESECLGMAQELDKTALELECGGKYDMAEKLYKQALQIRRKNLGDSNPETLAQNADLARISVARGEKEQARAYFEDALKELRKHPNPGRTYSYMLESYGDMLDKLNDKAEAEMIYEEARNANKRLAGVSP